MPNPPRSIEEKRLLGNPGRRPLPALGSLPAIEPADDAPPPATLGPNGAALWERCQRHAPWIAQVDLMALEDVCLTWDEVAAYRSQIAKDGISLVEPLVSPSGQVVGTKLVPHPLIRELRRAQKELHSAASAMGFNPTARSRLGLAEVRRQSKLDALTRDRMTVTKPSNQRRNR